MKRNLVKLIVIAICAYILAAAYIGLTRDNYFDYFRGICFGVFAATILRDCGEYLRQPKEKRKNDTL